MIFLPSMPNFCVPLSPADRAAASGKRAGDVCTDYGALLAFTRDYAISRGLVFVRQDQVAAAERHGWAIDLTSDPDRNEGLVTICR